MVPLIAPQSQTPPLISQYFSGREVFITGGTGFMGKVLVERLLWTCPEISRLHLLMRQKKDVDPEERLKDLKQCQVFDMIRQNCPEQLQKLSVVAGDITKHMFNMNGNEMQQLSQVSVVFHLAATLKFDEPLPVAVEQNVRPVNTIMDVCDQLPMVQVFIYASTAYSNAEHSSIEERVYPAPASAEQLFALVDNLPEHLLADITPKLVSPKPNTYTFTKAVAESLVADRGQSSNYATAIFRPSIVVSSVKHPFPGWIDNVNGPSGIVMANGKGLLHVAPINGSKRADMIPVDIVIDTLIAIAWELGIDDIGATRIYNCASCGNPQTWREFKDRVMRLIPYHPFDGALWYPFIYYINNKPLFSIAEWVLHTLPLRTIGFICTMLGVKQRINMSTVCHRMRASNEAFKFFTAREWQFSTTSVKRLKARLAAEDAVIYNLDPHSIDWESHCVDFLKGLRKFVLRERDEDLIKAQSRMRQLFIIHQAAKCLIALCMFRLALKTAPAILKTFYALMALTTHGNSIISLLK